MTRREHPRRRLLRRPPAVVHHAPDPALNVAADLEDLEDLPPRTLVVPGVLDEAAEAAAKTEWRARFDVSRETSDPPPLSPARVAKLEALTAQWMREVRVGGPGPDDTLLWPSSSMPPVPPARPVPQLEVAPPMPDPVAESTTPPAAALSPASSAAPARVSDWASRHDPRSLAYAAQARLSRPVPVQDYQLELGPVLDQGTTPPLSLHDASACVGMAVVAAANALARSVGVGIHPPTVAGPTLLGLEDARRVYARAQELDALSGEAYAGTSVLAGMKAGQEAGWWDTYLWAIRGTRDIAQALLQLHAPVVIGIPWMTGLEDPDAAGVIRPTGRPAGGHALAVVGLRRAVPGGLPGPHFILQQSRGPAEGLGGLVLIHHTHLGQLLAGVGEAAVPLPPRGLS